MKNQKVHEQVMEYSLEQRNSVITGGNRFLLLLSGLCAIFIAAVVCFVCFAANDLDTMRSLPVIYVIFIIGIISLFVWVKAKYPLYKEARYHYIKTIKKKMDLTNRSFENDDMYKTTVSEFTQPMEWYSSLVLGFMFIWMLLDAAYGIGYITGIVYGSMSNLEFTAEQLYAEYGMTLKVLDVCVGILYIISAVVTFFAWKALKGFKKSALKLIIIVYGIGLVSSIIYAFGWYFTVGNEIVSFAVTTIIINAAILLCNAVYFKKRSAWFVH